MAELRLKNEAAPYYIEYEIDDVASMRAIARLGGIVDDLTDHTRTLRVQVKVGDYAFDSSRFVTQDRSGGPGTGAGVTAPLDDNYDAIRREIWLTTDAAYKRAVSVFARKKAAFQNRAATDQIPDFSREKPVETLLPPVAPDSHGSQVGRSREAALGGVCGERRPRVVGSLDVRSARHELLPEQRRIQGRDACRIGVPPRVGRGARRRWHDVPDVFSAWLRAGSTICRRWRSSSNAPASSPVE